MTAPKAGDRVRVTVEGEIRETPGGILTVGATDEGGSVTYVTGMGLRLGQVEVLAPPEPWDDPQPGDIYRWDGRDAFIRQADGSWRCSDGSYTDSDLSDCVRAARAQDTGRHAYIRGNEVFPL